MQIWNLIESGIIEAFVYPERILVFLTVFAQCVITLFGLSIVWHGDFYNMFTRGKVVTNGSNMHLVTLFN